jgi:hypothetical protein
LTVHLEISAIVMLNLRGWAPKRLLLIGDTVTVETEVPANRLTLRGDAGVSELPCTLLTQSDKTTQVDQSDRLITLRPG